MRNYCQVKTYGPYTRKDGRQHVVLIFEDGRRRTVSYPKFLMEQRLGRELDPDLETINHINGDFTDNRWENLEILPRGEHVSKDKKGKPSPLRGREKGWRHGTIYAWMKKKCRCEVCYPAWRDWHDKRNAKRRAL
jgi:hypothetical protein